MILLHVYQSSVDAYTKLKFTRLGIRRIVRAGEFQTAVVEHALKVEIGCGREGETLEEDLLHVYGYACPCVYQRKYDRH